MRAVGGKIKPKTNPFCFCLHFPDIRIYFDMPPGFSRVGVHHLIAHPHNKSRAQYFHVDVQRCQPKKP